MPSGGTTADTEFSSRFAAGRQDRFSRETLDAWLQQHLDLLIGVELFGTREVAEAAGQLQRAYSGLYQAYIDKSQRSPNDDFHDLMQAAFRENIQALGDARINLLRVMRADVGPDSARPA